MKPSKAIASNHLKACACWTSMSADCATIPTLHSDDCMPDLAPKAELLRSLGRLVRGLSALFWGLPIALIACFYTARTDELRNFNVVPAMVSTGLLVFGVWQLGDFQKQERVWRNALDIGLILSLAVFFLSPFLYWWS